MYNASAFVKRKSLLAVHALSGCDTVSCHAPLVRAKQNHNLFIATFLLHMVAIWNVIICMELDEQFDIIYYSACYNQGLTL